MCQQLFIVGHSAEVPTDHLVGSQRWFPPRPQANQHAGDDRAVGLDFTGMESKDDADKAKEQRRRRKQRQKKLEQRARRGPSEPDLGATTDASSSGDDDGDAGKKKEIQAKDMTGFKYFDQLAPLLKRLHDDGCERDQVANRELHYVFDMSLLDDFVVAN